MMKLFPIKRGINENFQNVPTLMTKLSNLAKTVTLPNIPAKRYAQDVLCPTVIAKTVLLIDLNNKKNFIAIFSNLLEDGA